MPPRHTRVCRNGLARAIQICNAHLSVWGENEVLWLDGEMDDARAVQCGDAADKLGREAPKLGIIVNALADSLVQTAYKHFAYTEI